MVRNFSFPQAAQWKNQRFPERIRGRRLIGMQTASTVLFVLALKLWCVEVMAVPGGENGYGGKQEALEILKELVGS